MKYNQTLLFLIFLSITFNFILPIYGNSKQECEKCLDKCCNNYKNNHQLETCNDNCKLEHCDGVKINYKNHECTKPVDPPTSTPKSEPPEPKTPDPPKTPGPSPPPIDTDQPLNPTSVPPVPPTTPIPDPPVPPTTPIPPVPPTTPIPPVPIQSPTNSLGPVPPFPPQEVHTCTTSNDPACFPPGSTPVVTTFTQPGVETPTPPSGNEVLTTTQSTSTLYVAGYTTTNSLGQPIIVPPSSLLVVNEVAIVTKASVETVMVASDSTILHDLNSHGLWGITMSLFIAITTIVFMVIA
ncbi:unnamed protein product [Rhizophagus irregularis]|uniref:Uncharacterized protein n=1 Tax=Rhizophagus irregularis TaxID=588596 RepID=A0A2N1NYH8_9GLOM|nr:hypothetical protein RhiirC2_860951 [Rhizophagus irregularis]CAB4379225.1 unnamed protein product [Rhizophagus irregularis]CAB5337491.1 unnamed protein product [Rhizophagus irregularis]